MRNNFTNYSQIKFYKNALKLLKKHASIKLKHISLKFQGILPSYILNSFQKSMLLIPVNYEKQELRSDKNSTKCSLTPAENRRYCQWQKERTKKLL